MGTERMSMFQHVDRDEEVWMQVKGNNHGNVVVDIGGVTTFMTPLQFAQLKYVVNKFDVKEVK